MRWIYFILFTVSAMSCSRKIPFTQSLIEEYNLYSDKQLAKVQFYTSQTFTLVRVNKTVADNHTSNGVLIENKSDFKNRITINANTPGIVEKVGKDGEIYVRFEKGAGNFLSFRIRPNGLNDRFYLEADFSMNGGGNLTYGNETYSVNSAAGNAYLLVIVKKIQKSTSKERVVKGMKV